MRRVGEDVRAGSEILAAGMKLRPQDTGLAASVGIAALPVYRRLKVAVFFTGDELVMPGEPLPPGRIYNSNRFTLNGLLQLFGCEVTDYGIVPDRLDATRAVLRQAAAGNDLIVTSGGVSVGEEDHIKPAVEAEGRLAMWKIAVKPGRPLAFGAVNAGAARTGAFHRLARESGVELRHLSDFRAAVHPALPGRCAGGAAQLIRCAPISTGRSPTRGANSCG